MSDRARRLRAAFVKLVESISRKAQKQGQSRLRSCLASLGTVPVFGPAIAFSPAPPTPFPVTCLRTLVCWAVCWGVLAVADPGTEDLFGGGAPVKLAAGQIFDASGVALLSWIPVEDFPGSNTLANDLWGYVSPSGREYALMGLENGTAFVEVSDPEAPVVVGFVPHVGSCCSDIKVYQQYAYVVNDGNVLAGASGLQIIDMTNIDAGIVTLANTFSESGLKRVHNITINEESGYAYLLASQGNISNGGLFVVDLSDPVNPSFAGVWPDALVHDAQVVTYTSGPFAGREIAFAFTGDSQLRIIDVTDKSAMSVIGSTTYPNAAFSHQGWLSEDRKYVYLNDEFDEVSSDIPTTTYVIDVADLTEPTFVTAFSNGLPSTDHNLMVRGNFVFEANYTSGLRIYKAADPSLIEEVGYFDTYPANDLPGFNGAWSVYTDLPSGNVLVSDIQGGLFVLDPSVALCGNLSLFFTEGDRLELTIPDPIDIGQPIQWKKNGADLSDDSRISGSNSRTLAIDPLEPGDSGFYSATYDDGSARKAQVDFCLATVKVLGPLPTLGMMGLCVLAGALVMGGAVFVRRIGT